METLKQEVLTAISNSKDLDQLESVRIQYLSKKGSISLLMGQIKDLPVEEKKTFGEKVNALKQEVEASLDTKKQLLEMAQLNRKLESEKLDIHLETWQFKYAQKHPLTQIIEEVEQFFISMGFEIAEGPELESDHYNFEMMNLQKGHPARDMQDSFYIDPETLLRTHTSPVQARVMLEKHGQPLAIICPGKVYRRDDDDPTHSHQFMQIEGLVVGTDVRFSHLKDVLLKLAKHLFGQDRTIRLRPSYFPFTEPSVEVDVTLKKKDGSESFIEVLGAGMVHPHVLEMAGYDPNKFHGFAFGIGVERIAILKYYIDDIRHFYQNDMRFLKQFKGGKSS